MKIGRKILPPLLFFLAQGTTVTVLAQEVQRATGEGEAVVANTEEAKRRALDKAYDDALSKLGIEVRSITILIKGSNGEDVFDSFTKWIRTRQKAKIVEQEKPQWDPKIVDGNFVYKVRVGVKAVIDTAEPDPNFRLDLRLNKTVFQEGELMVMNVKSTKDGYLHLFNLFFADSAYVLVQMFPNQLFEDNALRANEAFLFPPPEYADDVQLPASLPSGKNETVEMIVAVATKTNVPFREGRLDNSLGPDYIPTLRSAALALNRWLLSFSADERVEAMQTFRIVR